MATIEDLTTELEYVLTNLRAYSGDYLPIKDFKNITEKAFKLIAQQKQDKRELT